RHGRDRQRPAVAGQHAHVNRADLCELVISCQVESFAPGPAADRCGDPARLDPLHLAKRPGLVKPELDYFIDEDTGQPDLGPHFSQTRVWYRDLPGAHAVIRAVIRDHGLILEDGWRRPRSGNADRPRRAAVATGRHLRGRPYDLH